MTRVRIIGGYLNIGRRGGGGGRPTDPDYGVEEGDLEEGGGGDYPDEGRSRRLGRSAPDRPRLRQARLGRRPEHPGKARSGAGRPSHPDQGLPGGPIRPINPGSPDNSLPPAHHRSAAAARPRPRFRGQGVSQRQLDLSGAAPPPPHHRHHPPSRARASDGSGPAADRAAKADLDRETPAVGNDRRRPVTRRIAERILRMLSSAYPLMMPHGARSTPHQLSPRQREILLWSCRGKTYVEIGLITGLSKGSIKTYLDQARYKSTSSISRKPAPSRSPRAFSRARTSSPLPPTEPVRQNRPRASLRPPTTDKE